MSQNIGDIIPHESGQTSTWSSITREFDKPMRKGKQMTATIAGAPSHNKVNWNAIDWQKANRNVNRLQARIVKATQYLLNVTVSFNGHLEGLSRMRGNSHVRFLGEGAAATPPPYPTNTACSGPRQPPVSPIGDNVASR